MTTRRGNRRIVVGVDGSPQSRIALEWAAAEAQRAGGEVDAVLVYGSGLAWIDVGSDAEPHIVFRSAEQAKKDLHEAIAACILPSEEAVRINPIVVLGDPWWALCDIARSADLLVVGTRGRGGFSGLLFGSVSRRCAERSPCPVVVAAERRVPARNPGDPRHIVVGIDGSVQAQHALDWAIRESTSGDTIDVVTTYELGLSAALADRQTTLRIAKHVEDHAAALVHEAITDAATPADDLRFTPKAVIGEPWQVLTGLADDADLLVVGTRGRGGFAGLLLGSVSQRCVERSTRPVVVVPMPDGADDEQEVPS